MGWKNLAFLHWLVDVDEVRKRIPDGLAVDTFEGKAFVGVVPFIMHDVHPRALPAIPTTSEFAEMNVRTYVICRGTPGVWFFSLDAASKVAVRAARRGFFLPYYDATFAIAATDNVVRYRCDGHAKLDCTWRARGPTFRAEPGSLEEWLTARYTLYAADDDGAIHRGDIWHEPWPLAEADVDLRSVSCGFDVDGAPIAHCSPGVDVIAWWRRRVR
jgi:uncharacterized protein YqjF (DUF2071 family)